MVRSLFAACVALMVVSAPALAQEFPPSDDVAPVPPAGAAGGFVPPEFDVGGYRTPNRDLSVEETVWHLRVALNVAALGCRGLADGPGGDAAASAYNALLRAEQAPLAAALIGTQARYRARHGAAAEAAYDNDMTRLYNFFAQPPAHDGFCSEAALLFDEARGVAPEAFAGFAMRALPRLEAPFIRFFAAYDGYRAALVAWRSRHPPVVLATAAPAPMTSRLNPQTDIGGRLSFAAPGHTPAGGWSQTPILGLSSSPPDAMVTAGR